MSRLSTILVVGATLAVAGCASQSQFLASREAMAVQTAVSRG